MVGGMGRNDITEGRRGGSGSGSGVGRNVSANLLFLRSLHDGTNARKQEQ
jgi:hypothetical protein